jgi:hypothetical protein
MSHILVVSHLGQYSGDCRVDWLYDPCFNIPVSSQRRAFIGLVFDFIFFVARRGRGTLSVPSKNHINPRSKKTPRAIHPQGKDMSKQNQNAIQQNLL